MTRLTLPLLPLLLVVAAAGCGSSRLTMPIARCYHVTEGARGYGQENVYAAVVAELPAKGGATRSLQRFPEEPGNYFTVRSGAIEGRKWVDAGGARQVPPAIWEGKLGSGGRVHLLVHIVKQSAGAASPMPALLASLSEAIDAQDAWDAKDKAALRRVGLMARDYPEFAPDNTESIGAFVISLRQGAAWSDPTVEIYPVHNARFSKSGFIGGATVECYGSRSRYEFGVALDKP